jgi:hypothetical protein
MKSKLLVVIGTVILCIMASIVFVRRHRPKHSPGGESIRPAGQPDLDTIFPPSLGPVHIDEGRIKAWAKTTRGRSLLCQQFGDEGNGLDTDSLMTALNALLTQPAVEQVCLQATIRRFNSILMQEYLHDQFDYDVGPERALERKLLLTHRQEVSAVLHDDFGLGGRNPSWETLDLIEELRLVSSCPDLSRSMMVMSHSSNSFYGSFRKTFRTVCRSMKDEAPSGDAGMKGQ